MLESYGGAVRYWTCAHKAHCYSHASSPQMQHCFALPSMGLPLIFPEFRFFSVGDIAIYIRLHRSRLFRQVRFLSCLLRFPHSKDISWLFLHGLHAYYSTSCYDSILPLHFSPDSRIFQLVPYYALCLSSGEWGFHPVHTTRFPHSQCWRHLRMWSISQYHCLFGGA